MSLEVALQREHADATAVRPTHHPRRESISSGVSLAMSRPRIAPSRPRETSSTTLRVLPVGDRLDDRLGAPRRVLRLEDPGADEHRLRPEHHAQRRVGRGRHPAGREVRHRQLALASRPAAPARTAPAAPWPPASAPPRPGCRGAGSRGAPRAGGGPPRRCCRSRPRPWCGSSRRPRRCGAAPRRGCGSRTRTAP